MEYSDIMDDLAEFSATFREKTIDRMILACLKDLAQKTFVQTEEITFLTVAGTVDYTLSPSSGVKPFGIQEARKSVLYTPQPTITTALTGGVLAAATYSYKVTAIKDDYGETLPCTAVTQITTGTTSTVTLTWTAISGASGYRIYGRTGSGWLLMKEVTAAVLTWTDDGLLTPAGAIPTTSELMEMIRVSNNITLNDRDIRWRITESNDARVVIYNGDTTVRLSDIPTTSGIGYQVKTAVYPTVKATIPTIYEAYKDTIQNYCKWKLYMYPKTEKAPWSDYQKAMTYRKEYANARANLRSNVMRGFAGELNAKKNYFASGQERRSRGGYA